MGKQTSDCEERLSIRTCTTGKSNAVKYSKAVLSTLATGIQAINLGCNSRLREADRYTKWFENVDILKQYETMHSNVCFLADLTIKFTPAGSEDQVLKVGHSHATPMDPFKCLATWATWATWDCQLVYMSQPPGSRPSRPVIDEYWPQVRSECPCTSLVALPSLRQRCRFPTTLSAKRLEEVELKQLMHHPAERLSSQVSSLIQIPIQSFSSPGQLLSCYAILNPYFRWPTWCNLHIPFAHQYLPHPFTKAGRL